MFWMYLSSKTVMKSDDVTVDTVVNTLFAVWLLIYVIQLFLALGTAYRCTKRGGDNGVALFIYLLGFGFAALVPGLGLHYYIKNLAPQIQVVRQTVQPQVVKIVEPVSHQSMQQGQPEFVQEYKEYTPEQIAYMRQQQGMKQQQNNKKE